MVTGASRGIGAALAARLAARGVRVALVARSVERLNALAQEIGGDALAVPCDVTDEDGVARMAQTVTDAFGTPPAIVVNNAGIFEIAPLRTMHVQLFTQTIQTNLVAPFLVLRAFLPSMLERGSGHVITIGSVADRTVFPENGAYSPAKYGARALHEVLRAETRGTGVRATLVSPGAVDTGMWEPILAGDVSTEASATRQLPSRESMLSATNVADAVMYALALPTSVNVDELRLSRS